VEVSKAEAPFVEAVDPMEAVVFMEAGEVPREAAGSMEVVGSMGAVEGEDGNPPG
jgi:hypothetical protein